MECGPKRSDSELTPTHCSPLRPDHDDDLDVLDDHDDDLDDLENGEKVCW